MTKTIDTLVEDILKVVDGKGGWDSTFSAHLSERIGQTAHNRFNAEEREPTLRMSNLGTPCVRKLWFSINTPEVGESLRPETKLKFLYGDILEDLLLTLAEAAGHEVTGQQDELEISGIKGHRDAVIDGVTVDVKSASSYSFQKFKNHGLETDDPFGYLSQLSSYVYAAKDDPLVTDKKGGAFLVIDKTLGSLCLDYYNLEGMVRTKDLEVGDIIKAVNDSVMPDRGYEDVAEGKSGNRRLGVGCSYCAFKEACWPSLRTYIYSNGPKYLTRVVKEPLVKEKT